MAAKIEVENKAYKVVENLGYQNGYNAKVVETDDGERVAVRINGVWKWWTVQDRLQPMGKYIGYDLS